MKITAIIFRFACLLVALALIAPTALASDLQTAIAQLPDEAVLQLFSIVALEMYQRGLTPETVAEYVGEQQITPGNTPQAGHTYAPDYDLQDAIQAAYEAMSYQPYSETFVTYDPPSTPRPTYLPMADLKDDDIVWVAKSGKRYHTTPDCSGMKAPSAVTLKAAAASGRTPCRDCAWWMISEGE